MYEWRTGLTVRNEPAHASNRLIDRVFNEGKCGVRLLTATGGRRPGRAINRWSGWRRRTKAVLTRRDRARSGRSEGPCVVLALGGNAIAGTTGSARSGTERDAVGNAMKQVADVVADGYRVVLTHGNGPQVGDLLAAYEFAAPIAPPTPIHLCVAHTQAGIGYAMMTALEAELLSRGVQRDVVTVVTRVSVDLDDPAWTQPAKPIGAYLSATQARTRRSTGQYYRRIDERGWRRVVPSPEPHEILDAESIRLLLARGTIVIAAGGGGVPVVRDGARDHGVGAVIDKDLTSALLARVVGADILVIATDIEHVYLRYGQPDAQVLTSVTASQMRGFAAQHHFSAGGMGPKVEAAARFVEHGGQRAVIASLDCLAGAVKGHSGTVVTLGNGRDGRKRR